MDFFVIGCLLPLVQNDCKGYSHMCLLQLKFCLLQLKLQSFISKFLLVLMFLCNKILKENAHLSFHNAYVSHPLFKIYSYNIIATFNVTIWMMHNINVSQEDTYNTWLLCVSMNHKSLGMNFRLKLFLKQNNDITSKLVKRLYDSKQFASFMEYL
jgi:hypothetical protein